MQLAVGVSSVKDVLTSCAWAAMANSSIRSVKIVFMVDSRKIGTILYLFPCAGSSRTALNEGDIVELAL